MKIPVIKIFVMKIAVLLLRITYTLLKIFPQKDKITLISSQSEQPTEDMRMLADELRELSAPVILSTAKNRASGIYDPANALPDNTIASFEVKLLAARMGRSAAGALAFTGGMLAQMYHIATARIVVVERSNIAVNVLNHKKGTRILQIWHAPDAIKKAGWQVVDRPGGLDSRVASACCVHRNYDKILCPAQAVSQAVLETFGAARYGYDESTLVYLGLPRIDRITETAQAASARGVALRAAILEKYPMLNTLELSAELSAENAKRISLDPSPATDSKLPVILYAPTFRDGRPTEINSLLYRVDFSRFHLVLKLHPLDKTPVPQTAKQFTAAYDLGADTNGTGSDDPAGDGQTPAGRLIADRNFSANDWFSVADVIITDYSGMAVEAAVSGIPSYFYLYDLDEYEQERGVNVDLTQEAIAPYIFKDADHLMKRIEAQFDGTSPYDATPLQAFRNKYAEFPDEGNTKRLAQYIVGMM